MAIAEIVIHTACTNRPRGPALALCQRPRLHWHRAGPHRRRASARHPVTTCFEAGKGLRGGAMKTWLTVAESAEYAGVSRDTIYTACARGELHHARIGGRRSIRVKAQWIDAWLERHARGAGQARARDHRSTEAAAP
jgi:excisionase family DNA binding protein